MCGIVGYFIHGGRDDKRTLALMTDTLRHRGPDDEGLYLDHEIALGVRRLSIMDVAMGSQPIGNEDDTVHVVHNGEIYNHGELRARLTQAGHRFRTQSDTEVLAVDGSYLPLYALSRLAKGSVDVVLSGDGGDELFCGYPTFLAEPAAAWFDRLPAASRRAFTGLVNRLPTSRRYGSVEFLLKQFTRSLPYPPAVRTQMLLGGLTMSERTALLSPAVRAAVQCVDVYEDLIASVAHVPMTAVDRLIYQHCAWYLGNQNLVAVDRASMACGLEVRSPFLAQGVVELSATIPSDLKLRAWTTKYILKRAFRDVIPHQILSRRKQGFGVPLGPWLRGPLRDVLADRLDRERVRQVGLFDPGAVERLVAEHVSGTQDHRKALWSLLTFDAWREHYLVGQRWSG